jgi:hypothetical protein
MSPTHITPEFYVDCQDCEFYTLEFSAGAAEQEAEKHIEQVVTTNGTAFQPYLSHFVTIETRNIVTHYDADLDENDEIERILFREKSN